MFKSMASNHAGAQTIVNRVSSPHALLLDRLTTYHAPQSIYTVRRTLVNRAGKPLLILLYGIRIEPASIFSLVNTVNFIREVFGDSIGVTVVDHTRE